MIIKSNKFRSVSVRFFDKAVNFNENGEADVSEKLGLDIEREYKEVLNDTIKDPVKVELPKDDSELKEAIKKIESEKKILKERVEALTEEVKNAKADTQTWKDEYTKMSKSINKDNNVLVSEKVTEQDIKLVFELTGKKVKELEEMAKELELPEQEWGNKQKEDLIIYLAIKAINANS